MMIVHHIDLGGIHEVRRSSNGRHAQRTRYEAGDGDVAQGVIERLRQRRTDVPFAPSDAAKGAVLPARDDDGRVRIFEFADLALPDDIAEITPRDSASEPRPKAATSRSGWSPMTWTPSAMGSSSGGRAATTAPRGCKRCGLKTFERFQASPECFRRPQASGWGDPDRVRLRRPAGHGRVRPHPRGRRGAHR